MARFVDHTIKGGGQLPPGPAAPIVPPIPGVALITSLASVSQPAATQRFFQATADRAGTWSLGSTGNAADFTIDPATGIYSVKAGSAGDGTTQIVKTLPIAFTPADGTMPVGKTVTVTLGTVVAPASSSYSYTADLSGANGTKLSALPGWDVSGNYTSALPVLDGNNEVIGTGGNGNDGNGAVLYTPPFSSPAGMTFTITVKVGSGAVTGLMVGATDYANGLVLSLQNRDGSFFGRDMALRQAGANGSDVANIQVAGYRADGTVDLVFAFAADGKSMTQQAIGSGASAAVTIPLVDSSGNAKTIGSKFGLAGFSAYVPALDNGGIIAGFNASKPLTALVLGSVPVFSATNAIIVPVAWTGIQPVAYQVRPYDATTNMPVTDWLTADSVVNSDGSGTVTATVPDGGNYYLKVRPLNDIGVIVTTPQPVRFLYQTSMFREAYNVRGPQYFTPTGLLNNWGKYVTFQGGIVYVPFAGITGYATVKSDVSALSSFHPTCVVISSAGPDTSGVYTYRIQITADATDTNSRGFRYSGTGTYFTVTRDGVTGKIAQEWLDGTAGAKCIRDLDLDAGPNQVTVSGQVPLNSVNDLHYTQTSSISILSPHQDIADAMAAKRAADSSFTEWWQVLRADITDAEVLERAQYQYANLPVDFQITLEFSNEKWNYYTFTSGFRIGIDGIRNGHYGNATAANPLAPVEFIARLGYDSATSADGPAANAGDLVWVNRGGEGPEVYQAKTSLAAGTNVVDGPQWMLRTDMDCVVARERWAVVRFKQILAIYKSVFGARYATQIKPTVQGFQAAGEIYNYIQIARTYDPAFFTGVASCGFSFYYDDKGIDPNNSSPAIIEAQMRSNIPGYLAGSRQLVADCIKMGKAVACYEGCMTSTYQQNMPNNTYATNYYNLMSSTLGYNLMRDFAVLLKANVPGTMCFYDLVAGAPFSLKATWTDTQNQRYLGWKAGLAA